MPTNGKMIKVVQILREEKISQWTFDEIRRIARRIDDVYQDQQNTGS